MKSISILLIPAVFLFSCGAVSPVINQYEKAGTLKKGNFEALGNFTRYNVSGEGESEGLNNNYGFRVGYGISDQFDLKLRYERLKPSTSFDGEKTAGVNYFSLVPKFALIPNKFSLLVPISHYSSKATTDMEGDEGYNFSSLTPQLIYTFTNAKNTLDLSPGVKADILLAGDGGGVLFGFTLGAGFSTDLNKWAIRPEVGVLSLGVGSFVSYGIGLQAVLPGRKK